MNDNGQLWLHISRPSQIHSLKVRWFLLTNLVYDHLCPTPYLSSKKFHIHLDSMDTTFHLMKSPLSENWYRSSFYPTLLHTKSQHGKFIKQIATTTITTTTNPRQYGYKNPQFQEFQAKFHTKSKIIKNALLQANMDFPQTHCQSTLCQSTLIHTNYHAHTHPH